MTRLATMLKNTVKASGRAVRDHLWPPLCAACDVPVQDAAGLCANCWDAISFLGSPQCHACGVPFPYDPGPLALCAACSGIRPIYERARAAFIYDDASRGFILAFKHGDRTDLVPALVKWMARPAAPLLADADIVAPVPLHWTRLLSCRYNQAALLANALARHGHVPSIPDLLQRTRRTGSQGGKSRQGRKKNVRGAFRVHPRFNLILRDKRVLLVDDVMTTGASVEACTRALLRMGAKAVDVITIARVVTSGL
ncbi:MAG: ComF family protein [Rhodospirillales bacterium]|nr:ComF family protein [Rhodospirillales bacterium]